MCSEHVVVKHPPVVSSFQVAQCFSLVQVPAEEFVSSRSNCLVFLSVV